MLKTAERPAAPTPMLAAPLFLSPREASKVLGQSLAKTYRDMGADLLDARCDGRRTKITMESILRRAESLRRWQDASSHKLPKLKDGRKPGRLPTRSKKKTA
jgi:hypothetical protein